MTTRSNRRLRPISGVTSGVVVVPAPVSVVAPVVSGTATVGQVLSCSTGTWNNNPTSYAYQWLRDGSAIAGANASAYTLVSADAGHNVSCQVTAINAGGAASANSNSLPISTGAPVNTVAPVVSGTAQQGQVLSCTTGTWTNSPTGYSYQWIRGASNIVGATNSTYTLVVTDVGANITCVVTATNAAGNGTAASNAVGPVLPLAPSNIVAPVISGTATQGNTLTVSNTGTWSNNPTSFSYQWKRGGVAIAGETGTTYLLASADVGQNIACTVTATNAGGSGSADSNAIGPIGASGGLATPTVTNVSATGVTPVILSLTDGDYVAGLYLQWQFAGSLTPAKNGDGSYVTPTQGGVGFIDGNSWARLDLALGYNDPSGPFAFHCRVLRDDPSGSVTVTDQLGNTSTYDASGWSTDYTDTISTSVAVWSAAAADRSTGITADTSLQLHVNNNFGAACGNRATIAGSGKKHFEVTINELRAGGATDILVGVIDAATSLTSTHPLPGSGSTPGCSCHITSTQADIRYNGASQLLPALPAAAAIGDAVIVEFDTTANTVSFSYYRLATTTVTALGAVTLTSGIPAAWYAWAAGFYGTVSGATDTDKFTANFGGSSFLSTPSAGYSYYG